MRWIGHAAQIGNKTNTYRIVVENLKVRDDLKDLGRDGRITLKSHINERVHRLD
jgi:IS1 family transposase